MGTMAKVLIFGGLLITAIGIIFLFADKVPWLGRLPGDIYVQRKNFRLYFPITTCIIISIALSAIFYFIMRR